MATPEELMIANTMLNVPKLYPKLDPPHGPRTAFYTTPERMFAIGYVQTPEDELMNYQDKVNGDKYAWVSDKGIRPTGNTAPNNLQDMFEHEMLFKAYPGLKNIPFSTGKFEETVGSSYGWYDGKNGQGMFISDPTGVPIAMHEVQHYIQEEEGWFEGKNSPENLEDRYDILLKDRKSKSEGPSLSDKATYNNRGDEMQSRAVDRTLVDGIPSEGIVSNMEQELIQIGFNPYEIRDGNFLDTLMELDDVSMYDGDYSNSMAKELVYDKVPGTGNLVNALFNPVAEDGGMLDDAVYDNRLEEYTRQQRNQEWMKIDGPNVVNPHIRNPFKGFGR